MHFGKHKSSCIKYMNFFTIICSVILRRYFVIFPVLITSTHITIALWIKFTLAVVEHKTLTPESYSSDN